MVAEMAWIIASGSAATISVFVTPGATALTRMLSFASSLAREMVIPLTANLLVGYPTPLVWPLMLTMELVLMITPPPCSFMIFAVGRMA